MITDASYAYQALYTSEADMIEAEYHIRETGRRARRVSDLFPYPYTALVLYVQRPSDETEPPANVRAWLDRAERWESIVIAHPWDWVGEWEWRKKRSSKAQKDGDK